MSKWDKLIDELLKVNKNLRFDDLVKILTKIGYVKSQPKGGSSHTVFRKKGKTPIALPKATPMNKAYIEMVREAVLESEKDGVQL